MSEEFQNRDMAMVFKGMHEYTVPTEIYHEPPPWHGKNSNPMHRLGDHSRKHALSAKARKKKGGK